MEDNMILMNAKAIEVDGVEQVLEVPDSAADILIKCNEGFVVVSAGAEAEMLKAGSDMTVEYMPGQTPEIRLAGHGKCEVCKMEFASEADEKAYDPQIPKGKSTMKDFIACMKLSLGDNSINWTIRSLKQNIDVWYMPVLEKKILFIKKYFITLIVWLAGIIGCAALLKAGFTTGQVFAIIIAFSIVDVFLISPLIYMAILPKPVTAYIRKVEDLTPEEMRAYEKQINYDPHLEKLMYKYRDSSKDKENIKAFFSRKK
ncbi:MAG: hypothetical protein MJ161_07095 [Clostridia bacterium]|nr:hypothetical protein [Clostridia bacterium]